MCESHGHPDSRAQSAGDPFQTFVHETPEHADAWLEMTHRLEHAALLEPRTLHLAYLSVLAALSLESRIPLHVELAHAAGATREEIASAVLVGLTAAGIRVVRSLPVALAAYDRALGTAEEWADSENPAGSLRAATPR